MMMMMMIMMMMIVFLLLLLMLLLTSSIATLQESVEWLCGKVGANMQAVCPAAPSKPITKNKGEVMTAWCVLFGLRLVYTCNPKPVLSLIFYVVQDGCI